MVQVNGLIIIRSLHSVRPFVAKSKKMPEKQPKSFAMLTPAAIACTSGFVSVTAKLWVA